MTREERQLRRELKTMRKQISALCAGCRDDENRERWTLRYAEELSLRLTGTLLSWDSWRAFYGYLEGTKDWADAEHSHRRTIAILDEEIDLHEQSSLIAEGARHLNKTVSSGCWYEHHIILLLTVKQTSCRLLVSTRLNFVGATDFNAGRVSF